MLDLCTSGIKSIQDVAAVCVSPADTEANHGDPGALSPLSLAGS